MWDSIFEALRSELVDAPEAGRVTRVLVRLLLAAVLGGLLGFERERRGKPAGMRTHMLIAMGAALFVLLPALDGMPMADLSRVLQGIVVGVGFLGAGAIVKHKDEEKVQGLTTAAGVWMTAAIGVACGLGRTTAAMLSALLALIVLTLLPKLAKSRRD